MNTEDTNFTKAVTPTTKHPLFRVTKTSKYLAMILFIAMPFIGGYIGYTYSPEKVVEVEQIVYQQDNEANKVFGEMTVNLCGKTFSTNPIYIDGINANEKIAELLSKETKTLDLEAACYFIKDEKANSFVTKIERVNYSYGPLTAPEEFEAYLVTMQGPGGINIGEGNLIDRKTLEVFRINEMDGSKGKSLGNL